MINDRSPVVVGYDGSQSATAAAEWARAEARSRKVPLRLVYAYSEGRTYSAMAMYGNLPMPEPGALRAGAEMILEDAVSRLAEEKAGGGDVEISTQAIDGDAAAVLLEQTRHASTIVLASRHLNAINSAVLGSVSTAVSARAGCPVVVVRASDEPPNETPAVVVGVTAGENCEDAIGYAFDYASRRSLPVHAVLCWRPDVLVNRMVRTEMAVPDGARAELSEAMAGWREKYPDVEVQETVLLQHPVDGLVSAALGQALLVVGTHGRGAVSGLLLGSVSQGVLHHASCPVAVMPRAPR